MSSFIYHCRIKRLKTKNKKTKKVSVFWKNVTITTAVSEQIWKKSSFDLKHHSVHSICLTYQIFIWLVWTNPRKMFVNHKVEQLSKRNIRIGVTLVRKGVAKKDLTKHTWGAPSRCFQTRPPETQSEATTWRHGGPRLLLCHRSVTWESVTSLLNDEDIGFCPVSARLAAPLSVFTLPL